MLVQLSPGGFIFPLKLLLELHLLLPGSQLNLFRFILRFPARILLHLLGIGPITDPKDLAAALTKGVAAVKAGQPVLIDVIMQPRG